MPTEKEIIMRHFYKRPRQAGVCQSIGDDAAILTLPPDCQLIATMDTLNAGIHFPLQTDPFSIGYKAAAVNLSDLAAMGATPLWITLSLSLPALDEEWLAQFSQGLFAVLDQFQVDLIGGDLNKGPLSITVQAEGAVPTGTALLRSGAKVNDVLYVSGELGTAAVGLRVVQQQLSLPDTLAASVLLALNQPMPQITLGKALRGIATSAIDLSDGLACDLTQICTASGVGAQIDLAKLPLNAALQQALSTAPLLQLALAGGDDYQLCFTAPQEHAQQIAEISRELSVKITPIGLITLQSEITVLNSAGVIEPLLMQGFEHF